MGFSLLSLLLCGFHSSVQSSQEQVSAGLVQVHVVDDADARSPGLTALDVDQGALPQSHAPHDIISRTGTQEATNNTYSRSDIQDHPQVPVQTFVGAHGSFANAHHFVLNQPVMYNITEVKDKVLKWLAKFTMPGVEFDASGHVPGCHPGTRITILETLHRWVDDIQHAHRMLWLHGPAGVGKSAILQSLAERLSRASSLGATLFFSRPNQRDNPTLVIPTIAYQLAVRIPPYKEYLRRIMIENPKLLEKDMERQFSTLIVEPFTKLRLMNKAGRWAILLDGLDECDGERAQALIVKLISQFTLQHPAIPLVWVIASRPEAHLQLTFNSKEVSGSFEEHNVPANSNDGCRDVEKFLRAKFEEIHQNYRDLMPVGVPWPEEQDLTRISKTSSGFFAFAATVVRYVEDPHVCDPISQLFTALSVTEGLEPGSLSALYAFYSAILNSVPRAMSPTLKILLTFYTTVRRATMVRTHHYGIRNTLPLVVVATMFGLQQHAVYGALRKLHSVIKVPPLKESGRWEIEFYHASFPDYLKILGDYTLDAGAAKKMWWNFFAMLGEGDYTVYREAILNGHLPVPLSWDVKVGGGALGDTLWDNIALLIYMMVPERLSPSNWHFRHPYPLLTEKELQNVFEKIDFSTISRMGLGFTFEALFNLFDWLIGGVPSKLTKLDLVKTIRLVDVNPHHIPRAKLAFSWTFREKTPDEGAVLQSQSKPSDQVTENLMRCYASTSSGLVKKYWYGKIVPIERLISRLEKPRRRNPTMDALVVGKGTIQALCVDTC